MYICILQMWILGNPIKIEGAEYDKERAIYISNHASPIDIFLIMWLTPTGTVGIAKKEVMIDLSSQIPTCFVKQISTDHLFCRSYGILSLVSCMF